MHRFFSPSTLTETLTLQEGPLFHQILNVFRAKKGDRFIFFEAYGDDRVYEVIDISKKCINLEQKEIHRSSDDNQNQKNQIIVFQAFPNKIATMETIVQKMVEIGVRQLVFFSSDRSQMHEIPAGKNARLAAIAQEALEQSGGNVPLIMNFSKEGVKHIYLEKSQDIQHIVGYPGHKKTLEIDKKSQKYALWIGPEGGWSENEITFFQKQKCHLWTFNNQVLRLETASIVGAGILAYSLK